MNQVVLLGFGGPQNAGEIRPFLDRVLKGRPVPPARYEEVVQHYLLIGGRSPYNDLAEEQAAALQRELASRNLDLPVRVAYRFVPPFISDVAAEAQRAGVATIGVILSALQSEASWDCYVSLFPDARFTPPLYNAQELADVNASNLRAALQTLGETSFDRTAVIFTAHSIPVSLADRGPYVAQLGELAQRVASAAGAREWSIAYQSRSGSPADPWLGPDIRDALVDLKQRAAERVVVAPIGFLCDHVEVLYDLDIDAASVAQECGIRMARARTASTDPRFIGAIADRVQACLV